jgi:hypothetical protein
MGTMDITAAIMKRRVFFEIRMSSSVRDSGTDQPFSRHCLKNGETACNHAAAEQ